MPAAWIFELRPRPLSAPSFRRDSRVWSRAVKTTCTSELLALLISTSAYSCVDFIGLPTPQAKMNTVRSVEMIEAASPPALSLLYTRRASLRLIHSNPYPGKVVSRTALMPGSVSVWEVCFSEIGASIACGVLMQGRSVGSLLGILFRLGHRGSVRLRPCR